jgi:preprotein translocase subunit SecA
MNQQRLIFYELRKSVLKGEGVRDLLVEWSTRVIEDLVYSVIPEKAYPESYDLKGVVGLLKEKTGFSLPPDELKDMGIDALIDHLLVRYEEFLKVREEEFGQEPFAAIVRYVTLQTLDNFWKEHLLKIDRLKEGIGLRGYGQKDPLVEYKREGFDLFASFVGEVRENVVLIVGSVQEVSEPEAMEPPPLDEFEYSYPNEEGLPVHELESAAGVWGGMSAQTFHADSGAMAQKEQKIGRNDPCPCGSGKKFKKCHGTG